MQKNAALDVSELTMNKASVQSVNTYWSTMFGCDIAELRPMHGRAFAHTGFRGYDGAYAMMFDEAAPLVSVPPDLFTCAYVAAHAQLPGTVRDATQVTHLLGDRAGEVIGPAALLYADASTLRPMSSAHAVLRLSGDASADRHSLQVFRDACAAAEWETGGSDLARDVVFGVFVNASLAAVAGYEVWGERIAHLAIVTHPAWRGRSLGHAAVLAAAQHALTQRLVPQYRTLESNVASRQLGRKLGFEPFATSLAVRLRARDV